MLPLWATHRLPLRSQLSEVMSPPLSRGLAGNDAAWPDSFPT